MCVLWLCVDDVGEFGVEDFVDEWVVVGWF